MDRQFMEHYFDKAFDDVIGEIAGDDEEFAELQKNIDATQKHLMEIVGSVDTSVWEECEKMIDEMQAILLRMTKLAYLQGATDREKMLR